MTEGSGLAQMGLKGWGTGMARTRSRLLVLAAMAGVLVGSAPAVAQEPEPVSELRVKVAGMVERAPGQGGRVLTGGVAPDLPGSFYRPTLIADVDEASEIYRDERFTLYRL